MPKIKYKETKHHPRIVPDDQINPAKINQGIDIIKQAIQAIIDSKRLMSEIGNILQYIETNGIEIKGYKYIKIEGTTGGYWIEHND